MTRRVTPLVRAASRLALGWTSWYTRDLGPAVGDERRDEIASDLWEQTSRQSHRHPVALAASIAGRVARGIPADLAWRWRMPAATPRRSAPERTGLAASVVLSGGVLALGLGALVRLLIGLLRGEALPSVTTVTSTGVGVTALILGLVLLASPTTRRLGLLWLAGGSALALHFGMLILVTLSPTFQGPYFSLLLSSGHAWLWGWFLIVAAVALVPAFLAAAWTPNTQEVR